MGTINWGRMIVSGLIAGVIIFIVDFVLNGVILSQQWNEAFVALGRPGMTENPGNIVWAVILNLLLGLTAMWIYAGIRPRFGAGVTTAIFAGLAVWVPAYIFANGFLLIVGLLPAGILWTGIVVGLILLPVATAIGAYFYRE